MSRVAITGYGIVSPIGESIDSYCQSLRDGKKEFATLKGIPTPHGKNRFGLTTVARGVDRSSRMAWTAVREAIKTSRSDVAGRSDVGLVVGTVWAETQSAEDYYPTMCGETFSAEAGEALRRYPAGSIVHSIAGALGIGGPRITISNACASGNIAIATAADLLRVGVCNAVVVIGVDRFSLTGLWGAERSGFVGREVRPFDAERKGTVLSEGAAALILECESDSSRDRARAWLEGCASVCEPGAAAITLLDDGIGLQMSMLGALADAGRTPGEIQYVNAHAPGTPLIDRVECHAISKIWAPGPSAPKVNATKSITGHMSGASAVAEAIAVVLQMEHGFLHGNIGLAQVDPLITASVVGPSSCRFAVRRAISNACGGGGLNTSIVIAARGERASVASTSTRSETVWITGLGGLKAEGNGHAGDPGWLKYQRWLGADPSIAALNRCAHLGGSAGVMAVEQAGLFPDNKQVFPQDVAVIGGVWLGGWIAASRAFAEGLQHDPVEIYPSTALNNGCHLGWVVICRKYGFTGPTYTVCGDIASGVQAVSVAYNLLLNGRCKAAVVLAYDPDDEWLRRASQWLPGCGVLHDFREGAAAIVLECESYAKTRGARPLGILLGCTSTSGPLSSGDEVRDTASRLLNRLSGRNAVRLLLSCPADGGMNALAATLCDLTSAELLPGTGTHCAAAEPLLRFGEFVNGRILVLAGESGGSQAAILAEPVDGQ